MIKLADSTIMVINPNGSKYEFESDEIQSRIIKSCLSAGIKDLWIAEDISLSIEYALKTARKERKEYTLSDINSIVVKILEETGFPQVAENFKLENSSSEIEIAPDKKILSELIKRHLGLSGNKLNDIVDKVIENSLKMDIDKASPLFFVELAKVFRKKLFSLDEIKPAIVKSSTHLDAWQVTRDYILARVDNETKELVNNKILHTSGVSKLFPAIKVDFRITKFIEQQNLTKPLTELSVIQRFHIPAAGINDIVSTAEKLHFKNSALAFNDTANRLPVYFSIPDISVFARECLDSSWPEAKEDCEEMLRFLRGMLKCELFKVKLK
jgi:hypothetical protein